MGRRMRRILVTGGAGFIGSHVAECLLASGEDVVVIDDLNDSYSAAFKRTNLWQVAQSGSFQFHECDICDATKINELMMAVQPDILIHLAARAGVRPSLEQPLLYERVNVHGTMVLLEACRRCGVKQFVFASSSSVYGIANSVPFSEDDTTILPISPYAATKSAAEKVCYTYSHLYGLNVVCLRFFTVYGPRQRPDLAIRRFTEMIDQGYPISVFGDGSSARDYTYISDIVDGVIAACNVECSYEVINLGNAHPVDLTTLICTIEESLGKKAKIRWLPAQPGDVPITYADITRARKVLGYSPATLLPEGIRKFVAWYQRYGKTALV